MKEKLLSEIKELYRILVDVNNKESVIIQKLLNLKDNLNSIKSKLDRIIRLLNKGDVSGAKAIIEDLLETDIRDIETKIADVLTVYRYFIDTVLEKIENIEITDPKFFAKVLSTTIDLLEKELPVTVRMQFLKLIFSIDILFSEREYTEEELIQKLESNGFSALWIRVLEKLGILESEKIEEEGKMVKIYRIKEKSLLYKPLSDYLRNLK